MKRAQALIPALFCLEGILFLLRSTQLHALFGAWASTLHAQLLWQPFAPNLRNSLPVLGISALIVAFGLHRRTRWAWRGGLVLAILHLPIIPFLTPIGALLLVLLNRFKNDLLEIDRVARFQWDRNSKNKKLPWGYSAVVASVVTAIGVGAYALVQYSQTAGYPKLPVLAIPFTVLAAAFLTGIAHEAGHALAAKLAGFQLANFSIGPFWLCRNLAGWRWTFVPNLGWTGALASARPLTGHNLHTNLFLFLAGGPLASLLLGTLSLILFLSAKNSPWAWCADGFGIQAMVALIDFLSEMSIVRKGHVFTDGARLMQLWTGGLERERLLATYALGLCETTTLRPRDWRPELLSEAVSDPKSPLYFAGCYYSYVYEMDRRDWDRAGTWLNALLGSEADESSPARRWKAAVEGAFHEAVFRDDAVRARLWLCGPRDGLAVEPVSEWRAEAAVHLAEGDLEGCSERILKIRSRLADVPETGWKSFELGLVDVLENKLNGRPWESLRALETALREEAIGAGSLLQSSPESQQPCHPSVPA